MRRAALFLIVLGGCSEKSTDPVEEAYGPWKRRNFILGQTFSGGATLDGTVHIDASRDGGSSPTEWIEVAVNGNSLGRTSGNNVNLNVRLRPGANWIRFFSSASRLGWEFQGDSNYGTHFEFTPKDKFDFDMAQRKDE
jgi:hypothetical protein